MRTFEKSLRSDRDGVVSPRLEEIVRRHERSARAAWLIALAFAALLSVITRLRRGFSGANMIDPNVEWLVAALAVGASLLLNLLFLRRTSLERLIAKPVVPDAYPPVQDETRTVTKRAVTVGLNIRHLVTSSDVRELRADELSLLHVVHAAMLVSVIRVGIMLALGAFLGYCLSTQESVRYFVFVGMWLTVLALSRPRIRNWVIKAKPLVSASSVNGSRA